MNKTKDNIARVSKLLGWLTEGVQDLSEREQNIVFNAIGAIVYSFTPSHGSRQVAKVFLFELQISFI